MLLRDKTAVIFGAGGTIGGTVARVFAREGAALFLCGRRLGPVEEVAKGIRASGGKAEAAEVDALNESAVNAYLDGVVKAAGKIDAVFNAVSIPQPTEPEQVTPSLDVSQETFLLPTKTVAASQFLTARAAARHMMARRSGTIVFLSATLSRGVAPWVAGFSAAYSAIEGLTRCLATEWSPFGIRVACVRSAGMPETERVQRVFGAMAKAIGIPKEAALEAAREKTLLKRMPTVAETAEVAAFLASDRASTLTGAIINASCGEVLD